MMMQTPHCFVTVYFSFKQKQIADTHPPELVQSTQHLLQLGHLLPGGRRLAVSVRVLRQLWKKMADADERTTANRQGFLS